MRRRVRWPLTALAIVVLAGLAGVLLNDILDKVGPRAPSCRIGNGATELDYDPEQAADAATIAAVAKRDGLADHAVTIALAAALQESKLYNVDHGDRDSIGIFQQRPSEGWGSPAQLIRPEYAATAFFSHLAKIPGWQSLPVAEAAQLVQHSADGSAYAQWEEQARVLARALTGEQPAGLACRYPGHRAGLDSTLQAAAARELGGDWASRPATTAAGWTVAEWLVAHSYAYGVAAVAVDGRRWTAHSGKWVADPRAGARPTYVLDHASS